MTSGVGLFLLLDLVLLPLAAIHLLWALGWWFPIRDEVRLVKAVVGMKGATRMPGPIPCALIAAALVIAAGLPWITPGPIRQTGLVIAAGAFAVRGILAYRPSWRALTSEEPFATLDRRFYGPLCVFLAVAFAALVLKGF